MILGRELGEIFRDLHAERRVDLRMSTGVERFEEASGRVVAVRAGGELIECDLAVIGVGVAPRLELARAAGLDLDNGVVVDPRLRSSDARVLAAGDIARAPFQGFGPLRVEHLAVALEQGSLAGRSCSSTRMRSGTTSPFFFSDQYDLGMEYRGMGSTDDQVVLRGDPASREVLAFLAPRRPGQGGRQPERVGLRRRAPRSSCGEQPVVDPRKLADVDTPLAELTGTTA